MEQHGVQLAETWFYDVHPERDPEGELKKSVTTADKIESACPQQMELPDELLGGSDGPANGEGKVPSTMKEGAYATRVFWRPRASSDA